MSVLRTVADVLVGTARWSQVEVTDAADVSAGWIALVVVLALVAATILLWLSMRKQLRKVRFVEQDNPRRRRPEHPPE